jgi:uncharacterized tellurite resistance protein B-like protein
MPATSVACREPGCKIVDVKGAPPAVLKSIRNYFEQNIGAQGAPLGARHSIELATAALLVEVVRSDAGIVPEEQQAVLRAVREKFGLSADESQALFDLAEEEVRTANDYYQFTSLINRHFDQPQKQHIIELMWRVAYADNSLAAHENHVLRRIAELLHVTHGDYIAAKMRARDAAGRGE